MEIVVDTSALIAVMINEPERNSIIGATAGCVLLGPGSIPWEIGNAFSAMLKQRRIEKQEALKAIKIFDTISIRLIPVNLQSALKIAADKNLYAYDAYFLDCAKRHNAPLLTLDKKLKLAASQLGLQTLEV